jgi:hypothetical protein
LGPDLGHVAAGFSRVCRDAERDARQRGANAPPDTFLFSAPPFHQHLRDPGSLDRIRRDFVRLPVLTFGRALALVTLLGFLFVLVLTMISGARELMTPGAWVKDGLKYKLKSLPGIVVADGRAGRRRR